VIDKFLTSTNEFLKKNLFPSILVALLVGCGVGFFVAGKRTSSDCILAVNNTSGSEISDGSIVVDLSGAVSKPGIYKLKAGSRVGDLLDEGGGVLGDASKTWISKTLNLSKKLDDSTKIYVPFEWEITSQGGNEIVKTVASGTSGSSSNSSQNSSEEDTGNTGIGDDGKTNVNTASSSDLDKLSGRPYTDITDFESRSGLWASTITGIKNLITF
jgi:competence protein ComEA